MVTRAFKELFQVFGSMNLKTSTFFNISTLQSNNMLKKENTLPFHLTKDCADNVSQAPSGKVSFVNVS